MIKQIVAVLTSAVLFTACNPKDASDVQRLLNEYNYIRLVPASNLFKSGSIVFRENYNPRNNKPQSVSIGALCDDLYAVDKYPRKPRVSKSESRSLSRFLSGKFSVENSILKSVFGLSFTASAAKSVTAEFTNLKIEAYSKEDLVRIRRSLGPICTELVNDNVSVRNAYQIRETLSANVTFKVILKSDADAGLQQKVIQELGSIGAVVNQTSALSVTGQVLVYGIKWDQIRRRL